MLPSTGLFMYYCTLQLFLYPSAANFVQFTMLFIIQISSIKNTSINWTEKYLRRKLYLESTLFRLFENRRILFYAFLPSVHLTKAIENGSLSMNSGGLRKRFPKRRLLQVSISVDGENGGCHTQCSLGVNKQRFPSIVLVSGRKDKTHRNVCVFKRKRI